MSLKKMSAILGSSVVLFILLMLKDLVVLIIVLYRHSVSHGRVTTFPGKIMSIEMFRLFLLV